MVEMRLWKIVGTIFCLCLVFFFPSLTYPGNDLQTAEFLSNQKRNYIDQSMALAPQEMDAFWRVYEQYDAGMAEIRGRRIGLATRFIATHTEISDSEALAMLDEKLRIDRDELQFKQSYVAKFKKVLPGRKVVRLYQTENRFDTAAISELYRNVPVIQ